MPRLIDVDKLTAHKYSGVDFTKFADKGWHKSDEEIYAFKCGWNEALSMVSNHASTVDAEPVVWIPITSRPMDDEERNEWSEKLGYDIANDDGEALIFTSQLPDDGQEVLVCGRNGRVWIDTFMNDPDYGCYFEENGDMDGIVAWMPLPKPYRERREDADK